MRLWSQAVANEEEGQQQLRLAADRWTDVVEYLRG